MKNKINIFLKFTLVFTMIFSLFNITLAVEKNGNYFNNENMIRNVASVSIGDFNDLIVEVTDGTMLEEDLLGESKLHFYDASGNNIDTLKIAFSEYGENTYLIRSQVIYAFNYSFNVIAEGDYYLALELKDGTIYDLTNNEQIHYNGNELNNDFKLSLDSDGVTYTIEPCTNPDAIISHNFFDLYAFGLYKENGESVGSVSLFFDLDLFYSDGKYKFELANHQIYEEGYFEVKLLTLVQGEYVHYDLTQGNPVYFPKNSTYLPEGADITFIEEGYLITTDVPSSEESQDWFKAIKENPYTDDSDEDYTYLYVRNADDIYDYNMLNIGSEGLPIEDFYDSNGHFQGLLISNEVVKNSGILSEFVDLRLYVPLYDVLYIDEIKNPVAIEFNVSVSQRSEYPYDFVIKAEDEESFKILKEIDTVSFIDNELGTVSSFYYQHEDGSNQWLISVNEEAMEMVLSYEGLHHQLPKGVYDVSLESNYSVKKKIKNVEFVNKEDYENPVKLGVSISPFEPYDIVIEWEDDAGLDFVKDITKVRFSNLVFSNQDTCYEEYLDLDPESMYNNAILDVEAGQMRILYETYKNMINGKYILTLETSEGSAYKDFNFEIDEAKDIFIYLDLYVTVDGLMVTSPYSKAIEALNTEFDESQWEETLVTFNLGEDINNDTDISLSNRHINPLFEGVYYNEDSGLYYTYMTNETIDKIGFEDGVRYGYMIEAPGYIGLIDDIVTLPMNRFIYLKNKLSNNIDSNYPIEVLVQLDNEVSDMDRMWVVPQQTSEDEAITIFGGYAAGLLSDNRGGVNMNNLAYEDYETAKIEINITNVDEELSTTKVENYFIIDVEKYFKVEMERTIEYSDSEVITKLPIPVLVDISDSAISLGAGNEYKVLATYDDGSQELLDFDTDSCSFYTNKTGTFALIEVSTTEEEPVLYGDINGNGVVNQQDRMILTRYLAEWDGYTADMIDFDAADVNQNGVVNQQDRMILTRYLAEWTGYESLPY